jgi:hypothetical protein
MKFKIGQKIKIIKYKIHFDGVIEEMDPIYSQNFKRVIGHWYIIKYLETVDYFCKKGDHGLFLKRDIMENKNETCR